MMAVSSPAMSPKVSRAHRLAEPTTHRPSRGSCSTAPSRVHLHRAAPGRVTQEGNQRTRGAHATWTGFTARAASSSGKPGSPERVCWEGRCRPVRVDRSVQEPGASASMAGIVRVYACRA
jgi:hypothetical protein